MAMFAMSPLFFAMLIFSFSFATFAIRLVTFDYCCFDSALTPALLYDAILCLPVCYALRLVFVATYVDECHFACYGAMA